MKTLLLCLALLPLSAMAQVSSTCTTTHCNVSSVNVLSGAGKNAVSLTKGARLCLDRTTCASWIAADSSTDAPTFTSGTATTGAATMFIFNTTAAAAAGDMILEIRNNGTQKFRIFGNGGWTSAGGSTVNGDEIITGQTKTNTINATVQSSAVTIYGAAADSSSAVGVAQNTLVTYSTAGSKLFSYQNNSAEKAYVDKDGNYSPLAATRRTGALVLPLTTSTAFTGMGLTAPGTSGTPTSAPSADSTLNMVKYASGAVTNNTAGWTGGNIAQVGWDYRPKAYFVVRSDSVTTSQRIFVGESDNDPSGVSTLAGLNANRVVVFRYDTGLADTNWQLVTSDATTASAADTGVAFAANTTYYMTLDYSVSGKVIATINGTSITKTTNLPTGVAGTVSPPACITTLTNSARNLYVGRYTLEQN